MSTSGTSSNSHLGQARVTPNSWCMSSISLSLFLTQSLTLSLSLSLSLTPVISLLWSLQTRERGINPQAFHLRPFDLVRWCLILPNSVFLRASYRPASLSSLVSSSHLCVPVCSRPLFSSTLNLSWLSINPGEPGGWISLLSAVGWFCVFCM